MGLLIFSQQAGNSTISIDGGRAIDNTGLQVTIQNGTFTAGNGGTNVLISSSDSTSTTSITSTGGDGIVGPLSIKNGLFKGGHGGQAVLYTENSADALANGGNAAFHFNSKRHF